MIPFRDNVPARRYPFMTILLILANMVVFFYEFSLPSGALQSLVTTYGVVPGRLDPGSAAPQDWLQFLLTVFTSMFLHGGLVHLLGNIWYLWIFGDNVEDRMGHLRFLVFYLICGAAGAAAHIWSDPGSDVPSIGASGAIAGVLGAYLVSYPFARVLTLLPIFIIWPIVELPALIVLLSWFLIQVLNGIASMAVTSQTAGVAWWAHIGGFAAGMFLIALFAQRPVRRHYWRDS